MWTKLPERYFKDLEGKVKFEEPLSGHTTLRIGGPAQVYFEPQEPQDLIKGLDVASALGLEVHLLGRGSNLLVRDEGVKGMVVHLVGGRFARVKREGAKVLAGAALSIPRLLRKSISFGLAGLECLAGIPGTVGGAVVTNAGGRWGRISSSLDATGILNEGGEIHHLERTELDFVEGKGEVPGPILWAEFRLDEAEPGFLLERTQEILSQKNNHLYITENVPLLCLLECKVEILDDLFVADLLFVLVAVAPSFVRYIRRLIVRTKSLSQQRTAFPSASGQDFQVLRYPPDVQISAVVAPIAERPELGRLVCGGYASRNAARKQQQRLLHVGHMREVVHNFIRG
jgi:UDP-N-acetylmuramate dehydrogenase